MPSEMCASCISYSLYQSYSLSSCPVLLCSGDLRPGREREECQHSPTTFYSYHCLITMATEEEVSMDLLCEEINSLLL